LSSAKAIGVLKEAGSGVVVEGIVTDTVTSVLSSKVTTVTAKNDSDETVGAPATTSATGEFTLVVPAGTYKLVFTKGGFLSYTLTDVDVTAGLTDVNISLNSCAGDVDNNGVIELDDLQAVLTDYNKTTGLFRPNADVDDNGVVELDDLQRILSNYNGTSIVISYTDR
ncbi:MAG: carboxypeptidase regulatory-like domain-containing protein, partial [Monoglobales bacterium]